MKSGKLRIIIPLAVLALALVCYAVGVCMGTVSALGWGDISLVCPLGALGTMIASKTLIPRGVVALIIAVALIVLFGRAFCAWVCPIPLVSKLRFMFSRAHNDEELAKLAEKKAGKAKAGSAQTCDGAAGALTEGAGRKQPVDTRHFVLGGALLSTLVFGFPVFCLICPIGLVFATIFLVFNLFAFGDITWGVVAVPVLLALEVVFFRKWCHVFCPLGAFMSLVGKANKTFVPAVERAACVETKGGACGKCARACGEKLNPRHPELSRAARSECTKCRSCLDVCPAHAISMPFLPKKEEAVADGEVGKEADN